MIRTLEENIHAVIGNTIDYKISEINTLLEDKQKEVINLANKGVVSFKSGIEIEV